MYKIEILREYNQFSPYTKEKFEETLNKYASDGYTLDKFQLLGMGVWVLIFKR